MKRTLRVVGCIVRNQDEILMLYRSPKETDPSLWGIPAGKVEKGETDLDAVLREVSEETAIELFPEHVTSLGEISIDYDTFVVEFPIFVANLDKKPKITLAPDEHIDHQWLTPLSALSMKNLMKDVDVILKEFCINKLHMTK